MKSLLLFSLLIVGARGSAFAEAKPIFKQIKSQHEKSFRNEQSIDLLEKALGGKLSGAEKARAHFAIGYLSQELGLRDKAESHLKLALASDVELKPYVHFQLGKLYAADGQFNTAEKELSNVLKFDPQRNLRYETKMHLGQVEISRKNYRAAYNHLRYAESRMRSSNEYPRILLDLVRAEKARGRSWNSCRWARKLYSRHPHAPLIREWGVALDKVKLDGARLGCVANISDKKRRIMWLQLTGFGERAREEIANLEKTMGKSDPYGVAELWASYLLREGNARGALNQLLPFYKEKKGEFDYLMEVAKYSDRAAESHAAIGAYYKAFKDNKRHGRARYALFHAGYLSYQIHDYDGAILKFQEFMDTFQRTGLRRTVAWHLAWIEYLRNNHEASLTAFNEIKAEKRRSPRFWRSYDSERIDYWRAMNLLRLGKLDVAHDILVDIQDSSEPMDYHSIIAGYRLKQIEAVSGFSPEEKLSGDKSNREVAATDEPLIKITGTEAEKAEIEETEADAEDVEVDVAADDDLEMADDDEVANDQGESDKALQVSEAGREATDSTTNPALRFKDNRLTEHIKRAQNLMAMGFHDWARWDLYEIERRTKDKSTLKALIGQYENIGAYHRSAYIGQVQFRSQRSSLGMASEGKEVWMAAFPQPYATSVKTSAKEFEIPETMIWSIMRAESMYREDAESPVGALGLMQVMPQTGKKVAELLGEKTFEPESLRRSGVAIRMGTRYLKRLNDQFGQDVPLMAAAYNAGPHRVKNWLLSFGKLDMDEFIEHIPYSETRNYVKKVVSHYEIYKKLYANNDPELDYLIKPVRAKYVGPRTTAEDWSI